MMIKLSPREAELVATLLEQCALRTLNPVDEVDARRVARQIRSRLDAPSPLLDPPPAARAPAGAILPPHHRASPWRKPIPGIDG